MSGYPESLTRRVLITNQIDLVAWMKEQSRPVRLRLGPSPTPEPDPRPQPPTPSEPEPPE